MRTLACCGLAVFWLLMTALDEAPPPSPTVTLLIGKLNDADARVRWRAASSLGRLGVTAEAAVPSLARRLHDPVPNVSDRAGRSLAQIGPAALPQLIQALRDNDPAVRANAARALHWFGPEAKEALPELLAAVAERNEAVHLAALVAIGEVGPAASTAVPTLTAVFRAGSRQTQEQALRTLQRIGPAAVPPLVEAARGASGESLRVPALAALEALGPDARDALPVLRELLKDRQATVRARAAAALRGLRRGAEPAVPDLLEALGDKEVAVQAEAANTLVQLATLGVPGLLPKLREADRKMRWATPLVLPQFGVTPLENVLALAEQLRSKDPEQRLQAVLVLATFHELARPALPALKKAVSDPDPLLAKLARHVVAGIERRPVDEVGASDFDDLNAAFERQEKLLEAMKDPKLQATYDRYMRVFLVMRMCTPVELAIERRLFELPPAAAPALVRAINTTTRYQLGGC